MNRLWLPEGAHYDLNIYHHRGRDSGTIGSGGRKVVIHSTETPRRSCSSVAGGLINRAEPHLVYGYDPGKRFPTVVQLLPFDRGGRALEHNFAPETNRANAVQIEVCGYAGHAYRWSDNYLKGLANLLALIHHRFDFPVVVPKPFRVPSTRFSPNAWVSAAGIVGHEHCPGNSHWDPGALDAAKLRRFVLEALRHPHGGLKLKPSTR